MQISYGRCPCGGEYEQRMVEVNMKLGDEYVRMKDIPQGACPQCGSRVYKTQVLELIEGLMKSQPTP